MRRLRSCAVVLLLLAVIVAVVLWFGRGTTFTIPISDSIIQAQIDKKLPLEKQTLKIFTLYIDSAKVLLEEGSDRVGLDCACRLVTKIGSLDKTAQFSVIADTKMRYQGESYAFHLVEPAIRDSSLKKVPQGAYDKINEWIPKLLQGLLDKHPVYTIKDKKVKDRLVRATLQDVRVVDGHIEVDLAYGKTEAE